MECPVNYGDTVDDKQLQAVYDYVKQLASRPWTRGTKYYWGHPLL